MEEQYSIKAQVRTNMLKSYMLIGILAALIVGISLLIGAIQGSLQTGLRYGMLISVIIIPLQLLLAKVSIRMMTKGQKADRNNQEHLRAIQKVEEMARKAGLSRTPEVYIVEASAPNAFATGWSEKDAVIGLTEGLLCLLNDSELEGVIAHEMSHIIHKDIAVTQMAVALVSVLLVLSTMAARIALYGNRGRSRRNGNSGAILLILILFSILLRPFAALIGNLLMMAVSRKREYAADADAVRLCGQSVGLANALEKLGERNQYTKEDANAMGGNRMRAFYITYQGAGEAFSTHPPIQKRIEILRNLHQ